MTGLKKPLFDDRVRDVEPRFTEAEIKRLNRLDQQRALVAGGSKS